MHTVAPPPVRTALEYTLRLIPLRASTDHPTPFHLPPLMTTPTPRSPANGAADRIPIEG